MRRATAGPGLALEDLADDDEVDDVCGEEQPVPGREQADGQHDGQREEPKDEKTGDPAGGRLRRRDGGVWQVVTTVVVVLVRMLVDGLRPPLRIEVVIGRSIA